MSRTQNYVESEILITKENQVHAYNALKEYAIQLQSDGEDVAWIDLETIIQARDLTAQLLEIMWEPEFNSKGHIVKLSFTCEKQGDEVLLFSSFATFVKNGSYIECNDGEEPYRYVFNKGKCEEVYPTITWEGVEEKEEVVSTEIKKNPMIDLSRIIENDAPPFYFLHILRDLLNEQGNIPPKTIALKIENTSDPAEWIYIINREYEVNLIKIHEVNGAYHVSRLDWIHSEEDLELDLTELKEDPSKIETNFMEKLDSDKRFYRVREFNMIERLDEYKGDADVSKSMQ